MYQNKPLTPPVSGDWDDVALKEQIGRRYNATTGSLDPELVRQMQVGYYACITHVDHQIGRLLMALVENRVMDDSIILFTSDHGEMLGDHSMIQKGRPWQGSVRIPMILSGAQERVGAWGSVRDDLVELRDVAPTLIDFAGGVIPANMDGCSLRGRVSRDMLHCEHVYAFGQKSFQMLLTKTDKYIWFSETGDEQYFDLARDPQETHNAIDDETCQTRIDELRRALVAELAGCEEGYSDGVSLHAAPPRTVLKSVKFDAPNGENRDG